MKTTTYKGVDITITHTFAYGRYLVTDTDNNLHYYTTNSELYDEFDQDWAAKSAWESLREKAREIGIAKQDSMSDENLSYAELAKITCELTQLAESYNLIDEFKLF